MATASETAASTSKTRAALRQWKLVSASTARRTKHAAEREGDRGAGTRYAESTSGTEQEAASAGPKDRPHALGDGGRLQAYRVAFDSIRRWQRSRLFTDRSRERSCALESKRYRGR